ncbi:hypothetical protein LguiA_025921 [Lonicera macranthoides]
MISAKEDLSHLIVRMQSTGADIIKLLVNTTNIIELSRNFHLVPHCQVPLIAYSVGERGLISQLLGPKFGGVLIYGSIEGNSVPGVPALDHLKQAYKIEYMDAETKVFGLISKPVGQSKGLLLHNPTFRHMGFNGIYVPMLVDDLKEFFSVYLSPDFAGYSAGRALAFGSKSRGARVLIFNIDFGRAKSLAQAVSGEAQPFEDLLHFQPEKESILANATPIGMHPNTDTRIPVAEETLRGYRLVFDAVYTPRKTKLLKDADDAGAAIVSGVEMFLRQAMGQFNLFTGGQDVICEMFTKQSTDQSKALKANWSKFFTMVLRRKNYLNTFITEKCYKRPLLLRVKKQKKNINIGFITSLLSLSLFPTPAACSPAPTCRTQ